MKLIVTCSRPGLIRGGVRNPSVAEYAIDAFSPEHLKELLEEPAIVVVYGVRLTGGIGVDGAEEQAREALAISMGLNLGGIADALAPERRDTVFTGPVTEQGTDLAMAGAITALADAAAERGAATLTDIPDAAAGGGALKGIVEHPVEGAAVVGSKGPRRSR